MPEFDLVVIGAGPGGTCAAIWAQSAGLRVLLVEASCDEAGGRRRPGETMHPGLEPLFKRLGVDEEIEAAAAVRHLGIWTRWGMPSEFVFSPYGADERGPWRGLQVDRSLLRRILRERATVIGVNVQMRCCALGAIRHGDRVVGVVTSQGPVGAMCVIDGSGGAHWLSGELKTTIQLYSRPLIARFGWVSGCGAVRYAEPHLVSDAAGWSWSAQVGPEECAWVRLDVGRVAHNRAALREAYSTQGLDPSGRSGGADVTWRAALAQSGPGYFLVGDAGSVFDPASSHGLLRAVMSGMAAAQCAVAIKRASCRHVEDDVRRSYNSWVSAWFATEKTRLTSLYSLLPIDARP